MNQGKWHPILPFLCLKKLVSTNVNNQKVTEQNNAKYVEFPSNIVSYLRVKSSFFHNLKWKSCAGWHHLRDEMRIPFSSSLTVQITMCPVGILQIKSGPNLYTLHNFCMDTYWHTDQNLYFVRKSAMFLKINQNSNWTW